MKLASTALLVLGILCVLMFFGVSTHRVTRSEAAGTRTEMSWNIGLPFSPWWEYRRTTVNGREVDSDHDVKVLSLSWLALVAGLVLLATWRRSRRVRRHAPGTGGNP